MKLAEEMLEVYYNSMQFQMTIKVLELTEKNPFEIFLNLGEFYEEQGLLAMSHSRIRRCEILLEYLQQKDPSHCELYQETMTFDLYYRENMKSRPRWATDLTAYKELSRHYCPKGKSAHLEPFWYDMEVIRNSKALADYPKKSEKPSFYLFSYQQRSPLNGQAKAELVQGADDGNERCRRE